CHNDTGGGGAAATQELHHVLPGLQVRTLRLNELGLTNAQIEQLVRFQPEAMARAVDAPPLSPLEQSDMEGAMGDWLDERGVEDPWDVAANLVSARISSEELEQLLEPLPPATHGDVLQWLNATLHIASLLNEVEQSTGRISDLVGAIKSYTYMDKAPLQEVDIHKGLENTLTVLTYKLKSVHVMREYDPNLPRVNGRGSELNQVWTNLIANAVDAVNGKGTIWLKTRCENDYVMVEVADDGHGIPPEVMPRLFEPFFTTKDVGKGTGLGLDISYRIITQHGGTIEVQSEPGNTRFIVRIPVEGIITG
ncbi:MAG: hypothetical protein HC914_11960, partial [Chloroflexaceae bacterium]|nr:hypothetical protein [Chloroflexaceae bacterium]